VAEERPTDELVIPVERWRVLAGSAKFVLAFLIIPVVLATALANSGLGGVEKMLGVLAALAALGVCAYFAREELQKLSSPGLVLNTVGFEFLGRQWSWREIKRIEAVEDRFEGVSTTIIKVMMRPGFAQSPHPVPYFADTPIVVNQFRTGGEPLEGILKRWLKRYGTPAPSDPERPDEPSSASR
jgi:hypothetical protein